jgi:hypothetical protein
LEDIIKQSKKDTDYFLFIGTNEKVVFEARGILNDTIEGNLLLTDKKLFFYFVSNISRDKIFIASYPYIKSVVLAGGVLFSTLKISNVKDESFEVKKMDKKAAKEFYNILNRIISENKTGAI